jgi:parallel beta-helix repeat protein
MHETVEISRGHDYSRVIDHVGYPNGETKGTGSMLGKTLVSRALLCAALAWFSGAALAVDGQTLINQSKALAGDVTAGDAPGFPVTITRSGSFRLSSDLIVPAGTNGIVIATNRVTLDLNGFSIVGAGGGNGVTDGEVDRLAIAIRNGSITGFQNGIRLGVGAGANSSSEIQQIRAYSNSVAGILDRGSSLISGNIANGSNVGISIGDNSTVTANTAVRNGFGIGGGGANSTISGNTAALNTFGGIDVGGQNLTISGNTASSNGGNGIVVRCPGNVIGNTATNNGSTDIFEVGAGCTRTNNNPSP